MTPNLIDCPACHTPNPDTATQCSRCATPLPSGDATVLGGPKLNNPESAAGFENPGDDGATFAGDARKAGGDVTDISGAAKGWSRPLEPSRAAAFNAGRLAPHTQLGSRYEILQLLGEGGMGAVYKAMDRELERVVALKIIRPELAVNEQILARFKQELILARRITHKSVIRIFDLGEADGLKFITMEYVEGKDLSALIKEKGRLSFEECADVMSQTCTALDAAHSEGVVHRDLKPQNIMVDKSGRVIVMDFGIARTMEQGGMTHTGALIGTPDYMSPEQVMGEHVDTRSDIFTLGIIFFQLLIGKLPYQAETLQSAMFKRTREAPRPPQEVDPAVPSLLSDITAKCLLLDPQLRYQSALEIQKDIEAWRAGSTKRIELPLPDPLPQPGKIAAWRNPRVLLLAAVLIPLASAATYFAQRYFSGSGKSDAPKAALTSLAIVPFHNSTSDPKLDWLGSEMAEMLSTDVGQSASVRMVSADRVRQVLKDLQVTAQSELDASTVGRVANVSNVDQVVWGHYGQIGDKLRIDATVQDFKTGHSSALKEEAASEADIFPAMDRLAAQIRGTLAVSRSLAKELQLQAFKASTNSVGALRDYDQGLQLARQGNQAAAVKQFQSALQQDPRFALAYSKMAQSYEALGQDDEAEQASQKSVSLSEQLPAQEKYLIQANHDRIVKDYPKAIVAYENLVKAAPDNTDYLFGLGEAYESTSSYDKARELFAKVVQLDPKRIEGLLALGRVEIESGNTQKGLESLGSAQTLAVQFDDEAARAGVLQAMGVAYFSIPRYDQALKSFEDSLEIKKRLGMKKGIAESQEMIASIQDVTGKPELALKNYQDALGLMRDVGDKQGTADVLTDLGAFQLEHGKYDEALKLFKESLQLQVDVHNDSSQGLVLSNIGNTYLAKGDFENARTYFTQALQVREKLKVPGDIADTLHNLAETSMKTGQFDQAQEQYLKALELRRGAGDQKGAAIESSGMGSLFAYQGRYGAAVNAQQDALKGFQASKEQGFMATEILMAYGNALAQAGRGEEAAKSLADALAAAREQKSQPQIAAGLGYQGDNAYYRGDSRTATSLYAEASQAAAKTGDAQLILRIKMGLARLAIQQGKFPAALVSLKGLGEEADSLASRYIATECLLLRGQALIGTRDYAGAEKELKSAVLRSEKLGLRSLQAQSHFQLGRVTELTGKTGDSKSQYDEARRVGDEIVKEANNDALKKRADLADIFAAK